MTEAQHDYQIQKTTTYQEQGEQIASSTPRQIFRTHALQHYMQKNEQSVLPRTISPFVFACCWITLSLTVLLGFFIWSIPVPNYLNTLGMPISREPSPSTTQTMSILAFFPLGALAYIRPGHTVQVDGHSLASTLTGHITQVDTQHLDATELVKRYALSPALIHFLPEDEVFVGIITIPQAIPLQNDTSGRVIVHYQQGTRQALSLLLDLGSP